ncbi:PASTA domain-containing protein [Acrocarpospora sp. B8E8]|uniref:PASTA domain-containing protein n=1 Tax=Acrocarpospora sp. B8E8 TaxID=3153572 RepID=UPI00325EA6F8
MDCHGNQGLGALTIPLTGHRTGVNADGSSTFSLSGQFEFDATVHVVVDVTINSATLSADGQTFTGTVGLLIRPEFVSNCARSWTFTTTRVPPVPVPSVVGMTVAEAQSTLTAASLRASVRQVIDMTCSTTPGTIMKQSPRAGTVVPHNTLVQLAAISGWPSTCP